MTRYGRGTSLALLVSALAAGAANAALPSEKPEWRRVEAPGFTFFGEVSERQLTEGVQRFERLREVLSSVTAGLAVKSPLPTYVYLFRNTKSFQAYHIGPDGKPSTFVGYFMPRQRANYITMDTSGEETPYGILYHEYIHYVVDNNLPGAPSWLNEGLAEFYSTIRTTPGQPYAQIGYPIPHHLERLRLGDFLPLDRLFAIDTSSPEYNETERRGMFYAQSWAMVHWFLVGDDARRARFAEFLGRVQRGEDPKAAFQAALPNESEILLAELAKFGRRTSLGVFLFRFREDFGKVEHPVTPMSRAETLFRLGDLLANWTPTRFADAEEHLDAAIALDPALVQAQIARAGLDEARERWDDAAKRYEAALDKGGAGARTRYGWMLLDRLVEGSSLGQGPVPEDALRARELFTQAVALVPDDALALAGLGRTYLFGEQAPEAGIVPLARSRELMPRRLQTSVDLISLLAAAGRVEEATTLLERGLRDTHAGYARVAAQSVAIGATNRAWSAFEAGKTEEGRALLATAHARLSDPDAKAEVGRQLQSFDAAAAHRKAVALYNEGVDVLNRGDLDRAFEIFTQVKKSAPDGEIQQRVDEVLLQIEHHRALQKK